MIAFRGILALSALLSLGATSGVGKPMAGGQSGQVSHGKESAATAKERADESNALFGSAVELVRRHTDWQAGRTPSGKPPPKADLNEAIAKLDRALSIFPKNWAAYWYRGRAYSLLGNHAAAKKSYLAARALEPTKAAVGRELTNECIDLGDLAEALVVAAATVKLSPQDAGLMSNLALALLLNGHVDEAYEKGAEALRLDPHDPITSKLLIAVYEVKTGKRPMPKKLEDLNAPATGGQR